MTNSTNSTFLKEMGITEWALRDTRESSEIDQSAVVAESVVNQPAVEGQSLGTWWFFGSKPQGEAEVLFQNIIRSLGLATKEWHWKTPTERMNPLEIPQDGIPLVAVAFGGAAAQKLSGERGSLPELRETVLAINAEGAQEIPLIATFELNQLIAKPGDKALLWQDLLLAKSVLQSI